MTGKGLTDGNVHKQPPSQRQSGAQRPATAPQSGAPNHSYQQSIREGNDHSDPPDPAPGYQYFVLSDPTAFRYLEEDPSTSVIDRRRELQGYECYIVEQWATSRSHPTSTITTYTGDIDKVVVVGILSVPVDEASWSPRLRVYFKALNQYHARRKETPLGIIMAANLSGFPSSLTVLAVPDGDLRKHRMDFFVNENLKRMGCSGRVGLSLVPPAAATVAKFYQLYRTSDRSDLYSSVIELVKLCQSALILFDKLDVDYGDGLLCDHTERAINEWWLDIGGEVYSAEPHDGILGPTTVAALLGLVLGARSRLHAMSYSVSKDAFDLDSMKRAIGAFQKSQRLPRTRRLDRKTVDRLHRASLKAATNESWKVTKAVKSTVAELSGRGGDMVMDAVSRRDRAGIAEVETSDIERFSQLVYGQRCMWLWFGKPMKKQERVRHGDIEPMEDRAEIAGKGLTFREGNGGAYQWTARKSTPDGKLEPYDDLPGPTAAQETDDDDEDEQEKLQSFPKRTGTLQGAKHGLGRIKGAVGLGSHQQKSSRDETPQPPMSPVEGGSPKPGRRMFPQRMYASPTSSPTSPQSPTRASHSKQSSFASEKQALAYTNTVHEPAKASEDNSPPTYASNSNRVENENKQPDPDSASETATFEPSIAGSSYNGINLDEALPTGVETEQQTGRLLRRTLSFSHYVDVNVQSHCETGYPRHLSFSLAEDSILTWSPIASTPGEDDDGDRPANRAEQAPDETSSLTLQTRLATALYTASTSKRLRTALNDLARHPTTFTTTAFPPLADLLSHLTSQQTDISSLVQPQLDALQSLQATSESILHSERESWEEGVKEIEGLGAKLEYEIGGLRGRVEDVGVAVGEFEGSVERVEERVRELEQSAERRKGWGCIVS